MYNYLLSKLCLHHLKLILYFMRPLIKHKDIAYPCNGIKTYEVIPSSKKILEQMSLDQESRGRFKLLGPGNEKRDMTLLVRGDIRVISSSDTSFFGCLNCGNISFAPPRIVIDGGNPKGKSQCSKCNCDSSMYSFDGVWKSSVASIVIGVKDRDVMINKL